MSLHAHTFTPQGDDRVRMLGMTLEVDDEGVLRAACAVSSDDPSALAERIALLRAGAVALAGGC